ncbi:MAG: GAF domain-containing protein [Chloroflexi bacterium]|nr:GAF domain-containing protein [Chloroflexota bacterium]
MITSHGDEEIAVEAMKAGLDDYVLKSPEHFSHFNNAVHTALSRVSVRRAKLRAEEKYRALVEQVPAIIYTAALTLKSGTLFVSPQIELTGYSQEEWIANPDLWLERIHPDDQERTLEAIRRTFTHHEPFVVEYRLIARDGRELWIRDEGQVILDASGKPLHLQGVMLDITERKRAEEALKRSEEQHRLVLSNIDEIVYQLSAVENNFTRATISFVSPQVEALLGYAPEEFVRDVSLWFNAIHPDDISSVLLTTQHLDTTPAGVLREYRLLNKHSGEYRWLEDHVQPRFDEAGKLIGAFGVVRDVTERKQAETLLRQNEERYRTLAEAARDSIFIINRDGVIEYVNRFAAEQFRATAEQITGKYMKQIFPPEVGEAQMASLRKVFATGQPYSSETKTVFPHGEVWLNTSLVPLNDESGEVRAVMGVSRDVTARKQAEEESGQRSNQFASLYEITNDIANEQDLYALLTIIVERATRLLNATGGGLYLYEAAQQEVVCFIAQRVSVPVGARLKLGEGMAGKVAQTRQAMIVDNYQTWEGRSPKYDGVPIKAVLEVPMIYRGELIGVLVVEESGDLKRAFSEDDSHLLSLFATQAASAVRHARLLDETKRRADEFSVLYETTRDLTGEQDLRTLLTIVVERAMTLLNATRGGLYLYDVSTQELIATIEQNTGMGIGARLKLGEGLAGKVAQTRQAMFVDNYQTWEGRSPQYEGLPIGAVVQSPMIYGGELIGVLTVEEDGDSARLYSEEDARLLSLFAAQAASAVRHARLLDETKRRADEFSALLETTRDISAQQENLSGLLRSIVDRAVDLLRAYSGMLYLYDPATHDLELTMERNSLADVGLRLKLGEGLAGRVAQKREPLIVDNYQTWEGRARQINGLPIAAVMGVPLLYGGELIGALVIAERGDDVKRKFTEDDSRLLSLFAAHVSGALRNAHSLNEMRRRVDELTTISQVSSALRYALTPAEIMPVVLDQIVELMKVDGAFFALRDPNNGDSTIPFGRGKAATPFVGKRLKAGEGVVGDVITSKNPYISNDAHNDSLFFYGALLGETNAFACVPLIAQSETIGALWIGRVAQIGDEDLRVLTSIADSAAGALHRAKLREQMEQQLRRLETLHSVEVTINSTFDLRLTLNLVLEHVAAQLGVEAADVLLFNVTTQALNYFTGRGFHAPMAQGTPIKMGAGFAAKAAMSRTLIAINDLKAAHKTGLDNEPRNFNAEGFVAYYGVPLLAKGELKGVLEVFHRAPLSPDAAWLDFLEAISTQATVAIDNIQLFDNLQRGNANLNLSFEETLESWARLSDRRTSKDENCTRRATELTVQLGGALGLKEADLSKLRHGALLHDVGSLLISDTILLKAGALNAEEQAIIRQHPEHSRHILSTIRQLQPALDIPLYHHERWDGSGYPLGLKSEQIPLAARIFAVVDVWMALRSPRPYRAAWADSQAREYLRTMAGIQFDPKVVETFLMLIAAMDNK